MIIGYDSGTNPRAGLINDRETRTQLRLIDMNWL